jgi:hypothetical protein
MIEVIKTLPNPEKLAGWLEAVVRKALRPDVSNYAKGRLRAWLGDEPMLFAPFNTRPGLPVAIQVADRLKELIEWEYDFCLVTYSGDETPIGIAPHMDAGYADFEAVSVHVSGECRFDYWQTRDTFGSGRVSTPYVLNRTTGVVELAGKVAPPSESVLLTPGVVTRFNCKSPHAATPGVKRWNLNFWRRKPNAKRS